MIWLDEDEAAATEPSGDARAGDMFRVRMLPADEGDCILLSDGSPTALRHVLVDGGTPRTYTRLKTVLAEIATAGEPLDAVVVTHIDADHIGGVLAMAKDPELPITPDEIWYNDHDTLEKIVAQGERQGDALADRIKTLRWRHNHVLGGAPFVIGDRPRTFTFHELEITILSPNRDKSERLYERWAAWRAKQPKPGIQEMGPAKPIPEVTGLERDAAPTPVDTEPPNGSSIALLVEWGGRAILLAADAHPDLLERSVRQLAADRGSEKLRLDLFKLPHHASQANVTAGLCAAVDCARFAISTSGARFGHPDIGAMARLILADRQKPSQFYFNYENERTVIWRKLEQEYAFHCRYPDTADQGVEILL